MSLFQEYFIDTLKNNYANFDGRARRSEYWYFVLFYMLLFIGFGIIAGIGGAMEIPAISVIALALIGITALALLVPTLALVVRRLHDTDKSGWFILIQLIPFGGIVLLVFMCLDGTPGANKYGPNPKEIGNGASSSDHLLEV